MASAKSEIPSWKAEVKEESLSESALRRDRKRRQVSRETEVEKREKMGRKPHFLTVDDRGRPYGLGAKSWRAELNKVCCALDPSVMDVRNQPHKPMMTLKKRLACKFEYSADIDDDWLRGEIGRGVSMRRFQLMEMIRNGDEMPPGFDKGIWYSLQRINDDPKYKKKSEAMRHANSMRRAYVQGLPKRLADLEARAAVTNRLSTPIELLNPNSLDRMIPATMNRYPDRTRPVNGPNGEL